MTQDDDEPNGLVATLQARSGVVIATVGMIAWFGLLWAMFGDVL
ncbi:hypothetical protein [Sphingobium sp. RAC03]|nr:hypothetical protein [Sphingobium sp. RAC03]AOF95884.1 hypothetical protein BSY17_2505 [Sphingobium sp. RAC03]